MRIKQESHIINKQSSNSASKSGVKSLLSQDISFFGNAFNEKKKERFYLDLKTLITAGVDLKSALEIIIEEQEKEKDKTIFQSIYEGILKGKSLANSLRDTGKFSEYEFYSIEIGEESNELEKVLDELIKYYNDQAALKKQIVSVMSYPLFVLIITIGLVYFMMNHVVPMFVDVFRQFGSELPSLTKTIIEISENFATYAIIFIAVVAGIVVFYKTQKEKDYFRNFTAHFVLRIPKVKDLVKLIYLSRFTQSLQLLLAAKTPLVRSLELTQKMIKYYPLEIALEKMTKDISGGKNLYESMKEFNFFPRRMLSLIKVGEEVNQLDVMLGKIADQYREELKHQTGIIGKIIEPLMILLIAVVVGVILVAMYLPMFNLSNVLAQ